MTVCDVSKRFGAIAVAALVVTACGSGAPGSPTRDTSPAAHAVASEFARALVHRDLKNVRRLMRGKAAMIEFFLPAMDAHAARSLADGGHFAPCDLSARVSTERCFVFRVNAIRRTRYYNRVGGKLLGIKRHHFVARLVVQVVRDGKGRYVLSASYSEF